MLDVEGIERENSDQDGQERGQRQKMAIDEMLRECERRWSLKGTEDAEDERLTRTQMMGRGPKDKKFVNRNNNKRHLIPQTADTVCKCK